MGKWWPRTIITKSQWETGGGREERTRPIHAQVGLVQLNNLSAQRHYFQTTPRMQRTFYYLDSDAGLGPIYSLCSHHMELVSERNKHIPIISRMSSVYVPVVHNEDVVFIVLLMGQDTVVFFLHSAFKVYSNSFVSLLPASFSLMHTHLPKYIYNITSPAASLLHSPYETPGNLFIWSDTHTHTHTHTHDHLRSALFVSVRHINTTNPHFCLL